MLAADLQAVLIARCVLPGFSLAGADARNVIKRASRGSVICAKTLRGANAAVWAGMGGSSELEMSMCLPCGRQIAGAALNRFWTTQLALVHVRSFGEVADVLVSLACLHRRLVSNMSMCIRARQ